MEENIIVRIAGNSDIEALDKKYVKNALPLDYENLKEIVQSRIRQGNLTLAEERIVKLSYEIAADLVRQNCIDISGDVSEFAKKVRLALERSGEPSFLCYDNLLEPNIIEESIKGYSRQIVGGKEVWQVNETMLYQKKFALELLDPKAGEDILDLGCGHGSFVVFSSILGANATGIDYSPSVVQSAKNYLKLKNLKGKILVGDVEQLDFADNSFDKISACDLYEHLTQKSKSLMLKEAYRVLKPGGFLLIKTPNLFYARLSLLFKRLVAILRLKNPFNINIPHTKPTPESKDHFHIGLTTMFKLEKELRESGFFYYSIHYIQGTKINKVSSILNRLITTEIPLIRDMFIEDIFIKAYKSKLAGYLIE